MTHKFDIKNKHKLDSAERRKILPPEDTLFSLGLKEGDVTADIGCGIGYFSIPAAKLAGSDGMVFALDISEEMLQETEKIAALNNVSNLKTILISEDEIKLDEKVSFVLISNVLHEIENKAELLKQAKKMLMEKGRIGIVEWQKVEAKYGPPSVHRIHKEELALALEQIGFSNISIIDISENFYGITAEKL